MQEARELVLRTCEDLLAESATGDETNEVGGSPSLLWWPHSCPSFMQDVMEKMFKGRFMDMSLGMCVRVFARARVCVCVRVCAGGDVCLC